MKTKVIVGLVMLFGLWLNGAEQVALRMQPLLSAPCRLMTGTNYYSTNLLVAQKRLGVEWGVKIRVGWEPLIYTNGVLKGGATNQGTTASTNALKFVIQLSPDGEMWPPAWTNEITTPNLLTNSTTEVYVDFPVPANAGSSTGTTNFNTPTAQFVRLVSHAGANTGLVQSLSNIWIYSRNIP